MSALFTVATQWGIRTNNIVQGSSDFTCMVYVRNNALPTATQYKTIWATIPAGYTEWIGMFSHTDGSANWDLSIDNGVDPADSVTFTLPATEWHVVAYRRTGNLHELFVDSALIGSFTLDVSSLAFTTNYIGNDEFSQSNLDIAFYREWDEALTDYRLGIEIKEASASQTAGLVADTNLSSDFLDTSGNANHWTNIGTVTFGFQPNRIRWTEVGIGASNRISTTYLPNVFTVGSNGCPIFYVQTNAGTLIASLYSYTSSVTFVGGVVVASSKDYKLRYRGDNIDVDVILTDPIPDPMLGFDSAGGGTANPRVNWPWYQWALKVRTSTYNLNTTTYAQDGFIEVTLDGVVLYTASNIYIKRNGSSPNFADLTYWPNGDGDAFWVTGKATYPTSFIGTEEVPVSEYLVEYLNFNAGDAPTWSNGRWAASGNLGPNFNLIAGLDNTGGASGSDNDPNVYGAWSTGATVTNVYGNLSKEQSLIAPFVAVGSITVTKVTENTSTDTTSFDFTASGGLSPDFSLADGQSEVFNNLAAGTGYSIVEDTYADYTTEYVVSNGSPNTNIVVGEGEDVTVTVTNRRRGSLTISKSTDPNDAITEFNIEVTGDITDSLVLLSDQDEYYPDLAAGTTVSIIETLNPNWNPTYLVSNDITNDNLNVVIGPGEDVTVMVLNQNMCVGCGLFSYPTTFIGNPGAPPFPPTKTSDDYPAANSIVGTVKIPDPTFTTGFLADK